MGQYLFIGLRNHISVEKRRLGSKEEAIARNKAALEEQHTIPGLYVEEEDENNYIYNLRSDIIEQELKPFLADFYRIRYKEIGDFDMSKDCDKVLKGLQNCSTAEEYMDFARNNRYQPFRILSLPSFFFTEPFEDAEPIHTEDIILSIDGKIIMESYNYLFRFLNQCIKERLKSYQLTNALRLFIGG